MSDEFDSPDASEKAPIKRPSDDVVQTAPVKCRYTKSGICANIAGFCLCRRANFALPSSHDARTRKALHDALAGSPVNWPRRRSCFGGYGRTSNGWLSQSLFQGRMMTMMMLLFSQKYITTPTIN